MSQHRIYRQLGCYLRGSRKIPAKGKNKRRADTPGSEENTGALAPARADHGSAGSAPNRWHHLLSPRLPHTACWGEFVISPPPGFLEIKGQTVQPRSHGPAQPRESPVLTRDGKTVFCFFFFFCYYYYFMLFHYYFAAFTTISP